MISLFALHLTLKKNEKILEKRQLITKDCCGKQKYDKQRYLNLSFNKKNVFQKRFSYLFDQMIVTFNAIQSKTEIFCWSIK